MKFLITIFLFFLVKESISVEPDEILENKELEKVAREIGKSLRCLVCQNEDIENSNADIAKDLRLLVRKKLSEGESKTEIISFVHSRYGDFVLFSPPLRYDTLGLWILPLLFFLFLSYLFFRKKN
ncbi:MAG: cytochrome c-type biogenesis protein [Pseudomonadota bacterium]|nr:cytochrome c-type biogenesis protein [Pseudomonadota bacterium]